MDASTMRWMAEVAADEAMRDSGLTLDSALLRALLMHDALIDDDEWYVLKALVQWEMTTRQQIDAALAIG